MQLRDCCEDAPVSCCMLNITAVAMGGKNSCFLYGDSATLQRHMWLPTSCGFELTSHLFLDFWRYCFGSTAIVVSGFSGYVWALDLEHSPLYFSKASKSVIKTKSVQPNFMLLWPLWDTFSNLQSLKFHWVLKEEWIDYEESWVLELLTQDSSGWTGETLTLL